MRETWRPIPDFPNYEASTLGRVRSQQKLLKFSETFNGYFRVTLSLKGKSRLYAVSRLVARAFNGPCLEGLVCAHLNGNKKDNRPSNLFYCTHKENNFHKRAHGTHLLGEKVASAKLTTADVHEIRRLTTIGYYGNTYEIAEKFGVSMSAIVRVVTRVTWKHI